MPPGHLAPELHTERNRTGQRAGASRNEAPRFGIEPKYQPNSVAEPMLACHRVSGVRTPCQGEEPRPWKDSGDQWATTNSAQDLHTWGLYCMYLHVSDPLGSDQPVVADESPTRRPDALLAIRRQGNVGRAGVATVERPLRLAVADDEDARSRHPCRETWLTSDGGAVAVFGTRTRANYRCQVLRTVRRVERSGQRPGFPIPDFWSQSGLVRQEMNHDGEATPLRYLILVDGAPPVLTERRWFLYSSVDGRLGGLATSMCYLDRTRGNDEEKRWPGSKIARVLQGRWVPAI